MPCPTSKMRPLLIQACTLCLLVFYSQILSSNETCMKANDAIATKKDMGPTIRHCLADCLELLKHDKKCTFHRITGKAEGNCDEDFTPLTFDRMLGCEFHSDPFKTSRSVAEKICDFMIFPNLFRFNKISKQLGEYKEMIEQALPYIQSANAKGIKTWLRVGTAYRDDDLGAKDFSEMTADASQRTKLISLISGTLLKYEMDGVFIYWQYPGCPENKCGSQFSKDRASAIIFYKELALVMQASGKIVVNHWNAIDLSEMKYLGSDFQEIIVKYVNFTIIDAMGQTGVWKHTLDYSRNIFNMEAYFQTVFSIFGPNLKKKAILSRDLFFMRFALLDPSKTAIGSRYNQSASDQGLTIRNMCKLFKESQFTRVKNYTYQPYAFSSTDWVMYEDINHVKLEVEKLVKKYDMAGIYLQYLFNDDYSGECGAGRLPYARMYAEALKGGACIFKDIF